MVSLLSLLSLFFATASAAAVPGDTPARRLYAAAGFVEGGRREDYYSVGRHAIFMERALDS